MDKFWDEVVKHESFGLISFSRVNTTPSVILFGSSIPNRQFIKMDIHHASLRRKLNQDKHFTEGLICTVNMSYTQFAEAITSLNQGGGVPCTIDFANGKRIDSFPYRNQRLKIDEEFKALTEEIVDENNEFIEKINEILNKKSIGKGDRAEIKKQIGFLMRQITGHMPFIKKQFTEQMDKTVLEAKHEFDGHVDSKLKMLGLGGFKEQLLALTLDETPPLEGE